MNVGCLMTRIMFRACSKNVGDTLLFASALESDIASLLSHPWECSVVSNNELVLTDYRLYSTKNVHISIVVVYYVYFG